MAKNSQGGKAVAKTLELATPLAESLGLSIWDVVFEKEGATWYLRVYIDKPEGIDIEDCEAFHRPFNKILDEEDFIKEKDWIFETCSPGLGRKLRKEEHFEKFKGSEIRVCLIRADENGEKEIVGTLDGYTKDSVTVSGREIKISDTAYIKLNDDAGLFDE